MVTNVNYKSDIESQKNWFPYSISERPDDFVIQNGVHGRCPTAKCDEQCNKNNPNYFKNFTVADVIHNKPDIGCFGCSFTYGSFLSESDTWPNLLQQSLGRQTGNFGVPNGGPDACLTNLVNAHKHFGINTAVVLFPVMDRRLLKFTSNGLYFQLPVGPWSDWIYDFFSLNHFDKSFIKDKIAHVKKQIALDVDNKYSKEKIMQIKDYCNNNNIRLYVSSWDATTKNFLAQNGFNVLPLYGMWVTTERAGDDYHPCRVHNLDWVSKIAPSIS